MYRGTGSFGNWGRAVHTSTLLLVAAICCGCGGGGGSSEEEDTDTDSGTDTGGDAAESTVAGTVTLPADATDRCIMIAVDDDTTGQNGSARRPDGSYLLTYEVVAGTTASFSFEDVPDGSYFLWAYVDADGDVTDPPTNCEPQGGPNGGDHLGYYDTGLAPPGAPNVTLPHAADAVFDFELGVFP